MNKNSDLALDIINGSPTNGTHIQQWTSNGFQQQQWKLLDVGNPFASLTTPHGPTSVYVFINNLTGKVLDVTSGANGGLIQQDDYVADYSQLWELLGASSGYYEIKNLGTDKVLDITGGSLNGGALLQQWDYLGGANQQWQLVPVNN